MKIIKNIHFYLLVLILSFGTILPLFNPGFFEFHDNTQIARVYEMGNALKDGVFPVRWVENLGYGYGYPIFNFYAPLAYYVGGILLTIGFNLLTSTKLMFAFGILISSVSMFLFSKRFFGNIAGICSAILYAYFPYHAVNIYVRGAVAEFYAYAFLPLFFLGIFSLMEIKEKKDFIFSNINKILLIASSVFLITISHNLSIFMTLLVFIPTIALLLFFSQNKKEVLILSILPIIIGFSLSAFYVIPAFTEMNYTNVSSQVGGGSDFKDHFVCLQQYWNSEWGFGGSIPGCIDGESFKLGKTNIILLLISIVLLIYSVYKKKFRTEEKVSILTLLILSTSFFLTLKESEIIWRNIPFMPYLQFPWRFINFIALFISFLVGYAVFFTNQFKKYYSFAMCIVIILITIVFSLKLFNPQYYEYFVDNVFISEDYIKFNISKISDEYMPKGFDKPKKIQELPTVSASFQGNGKITILEKDVQYQKYEYNLQSDDKLFINTAYFPSWRAYINGNQIKIDKTSKGMAVQIPKGNGVFELKFKSTNASNIGNSVSLFTILLSIVGIIYYKIKRYGK